MSPSWDDVEVGDKVVIETKFTVKSVAAIGGGWEFEEEENEDFVFVTEGIDTLKSVEKPVRTFKPGDVIKARDKKFDPGIYTIGEGRFFDHTYKQWCEWMPTDFTTDRYKVIK